MRREINAQSLSLLTNKNYAGLEELAAQHRASREQFANGYWKLTSVYNGIEPADDAPDEVWPIRLNQIQAWVVAKPESITARIALARILAFYGWKARSNEYADKVTADGWKLFKDRLQKALVILEQAKQIKEKCPVYWSSLQLVALGLEFSRAQYDTIFAQAIQAYPDYQYYYFARATYLMPRWNGQPGELARDLTKSADLLGGEAGDVLYARVAWELNHYADAENVFDDNKLSWQRTDQGFAVILKNFPDSLPAKTERAYQASMAGKLIKARAAFLETKGEVDLSLWDSRESFDEFYKWLVEP